MATDEKERIVVEVPENFPAMSEPVKEEERYSDQDIVLSRAEEKDLLDIAKNMYAAFPEVWWQLHEPLASRPPEDERNARMAKRLSPLLRWPVYHPIKASLRSTGEFMGFAGWHECTPALFDELGGKYMNGFRQAGVEDSPTGLGFAKLMGWSDEEVKSMWEAVDVGSWEGEFEMYDRIRVEELGKRLHWYLAPLFVREKFRGRGVGKKLLDYAIEKADAKSPPTTLYLEALPNARPVYLHCGFTGREGPKRQSVMVRNG